MIEILQANRTAFVEQLAARVAAIPQYSLVNTEELRRNIDNLFGDLLVQLAEGKFASVKERFVEIAQQRIEQGFAPSDFLQAVLLASPVLREVVPSAAETAELLAAERTFHEIAGIAATIYADVMGRRLKAKNEELNRLNARLLAQEKLLSIEAMGTSRALEAANEFNRRVIESLNSGLMVVDSQTLQVTLFTSRAQEIIGLDAEKVIGGKLPEALAGVQGIEFQAMITTVRTEGRLPLTKFLITLPNGRRRSVYVRAQRMVDYSGAPRGTVVVFDDITERELLFDSFSRYVSRDLLRRLLAQAEPLGLEGERRSTSILFAHLSGFAALGEILSPEHLHATLDVYFRAVVDGITLHGGFIDKFVGDKVMGLFSMASEPEVTAAAATRAALAVQQRVALVSAERAARDEPALSVCIGINTGDVVLGNLGNEERMTFTAIGDAVNVADAICIVTPPGTVLVSETTAELIKGRFDLAAIDPLVVTGRSGSICAYRLLTSENQSTEDR
jgi:PAS domain S-box-containing protein